MVGLTTRGEFRKKGGNAGCYVQFNPLVNESIMNLSFRQYNYKIGMQIRSPLARYIYKRMSHYWTQASPDSPYTPSLISFLTQSPRELSPRMPENVRAMKLALEALIKQEVISDYDANQIKDGRRVIDVRYVIRPHENFVKQVMASNKRKQQTELRAIKHGMIDHDIIDEPQRKGDSHQNLPPLWKRKIGASAPFLCQKKAHKVRPPCRTGNGMPPHMGSCTDRANVTPDAAWAGALYMGSLHGSRKLSLSIVQA